MNTELNGFRVLNRVLDIQKSVFILAVELCKAVPCPEKRVLKQLLRTFNNDF